MYGYEYEEYILRILRLAKYLHQQDPGELNAVLRIFDEPFNEDMMYEVIEALIWGIFSDVVFDTDPETDGDVNTFSHPLIKRFCALSKEWSMEQGYIADAWLKKLSDIAEFYLIGTGHSVWNMECRPAGTSARIKVWFSLDCYDSLEFGNALVDMLLHLQRENERLEGLLADFKRREEAA